MIAVNVSGILAVGTRVTCKATAVANLIEIVALGHFSLNRMFEFRSLLTRGLGRVESDVLYVEPSVGPVSIARFKNRACRGN